MDLRFRLLRLYALGGKIQQVHTKIYNNEIDINGMGRRAIITQRDMKLDIYTKKAANSWKS